MLFAQTAILAVVFAAILLVLSFLLIALFVWILSPWLQAQASEVPVTVLDVIGMRLRRTDIHRVLAALIMAKRLGVDLSCADAERAHRQGVDLEKVLLAMVEAIKHNPAITFQELADAESEGRLAEKLEQ